MAEGATAQIGKLTSVLVPPGSRPPFQKKVDLEWWRRNIDTPLGKDALKYLNPIDVMDLKRAIAGQANAEIPTEVTTDAGQYP
jgi:hypothetical protein